jgi:hypothetical protein
MPEPEGYESNYEARGYESPYRFLFITESPFFGATVDHTLFLTQSVSVNVTKVLSVSQNFLLVQDVQRETTLNFSPAHTLALSHAVDLNKTLNKSISQSLTLVQSVVLDNAYGALQWDDATDLYWDDNTLLYWS